jgi:hypothetical protein
VEPRSLRVAHAYVNADGNSDADTHSLTVIDSNTDDVANSDTDSNTFGYAYCYCYCYSYGHSNAYSNAKLYSVLHFHLLHRRYDRSRDNRHRQPR